MIKLNRQFMLPHARLGWLLLVIGAIGWHVFGRHADWSSLLFLQQQLSQTTGTVSHVAPTGFTIGSENDGAIIQAVYFEFTEPEGDQLTGRSWTDGLAPERGEQVAVEFVSSRPRINRIVSFRSGLLPLWAGGVLVFPVFGIICILKSVLIIDRRMVNKVAKFQSDN